MVFVPLYWPMKMKDALGPIFGPLARIQSLGLDDYLAAPLSFEIEQSFCAYLDARMNLCVVICSGQRSLVSWQCVALFVEHPNDAGVAQLAGHFFPYPPCHCVSVGVHAVVPLHEIAGVRLPSCLILCGELTTLCS